MVYLCDEVKQSDKSDKSDVQQHEPDYMKVN